MVRNIIPSYTILLGIVFCYMAVEGFSWCRSSFWRAAQHWELPLVSAVPAVLLTCVSGHSMSAECLLFGSFPVGPGRSGPMQMWGIEWDLRQGCIDYC